MITVTTSVKRIIDFIHNTKDVIPFNEIELSPYLLIKNTGMHNFTVDCEVKATFDDKVVLEYISPLGSRPDKMTSTMSEKGDSPNHPIEYGVTWKLFPPDYKMPNVEDISVFEGLKIIFPKVCKFYTKKKDTGELELHKELNEIHNAKTLEDFKNNIAFKRVFNISFGDTVTTTRIDIYAYEALLQKELWKLQYNHRYELN